MPISVAGPYVVGVSSDQQPQVDSFGTLKACAADILNARNKQSILDLAGRGILKGIDYINMHSLFGFATEQQASIALVSGTDTIATPSDIYAIRQLQLVDSSSDEYRTLQFIPWDDFNQLLHEQDDDGLPTHWTVRNSFDDEQIILWPTPDAGAASDYTVTLTYYTRIERPSKDSDIIDAPRELSEVLCAYAEYYLLWMRERETGSWSPAWRAFKDRLDLFRRSRRRQPQDTGTRRRIQLAAPRNTTFDPLS